MTPAHILAIFQKDKELVVSTQGEVSCQLLQRDFMDRKCLLEDSQVFPTEDSRLLTGPLLAPIILLLPLWQPQSKEQGP